MLIRETTGSAVLSMLFSPDGERLVTANSNRTVQIWNASILEITEEFPGGPTLAFSPTGSHLILGSNQGDALVGILRIRDLSHPSSHDSIVKFPGPISGIAFVGREQMVIGLGKPGVACHFPTSLWLLKLASLSPVKLPVDCRNGIRCLAGYPERRTVIWVTDNKWLYVQDITRPPAKPNVLQKDCRSIALSPDGKMLAATSDWDVLLFDLDRWPSPPRIVGRHTGMVTCLAFTPDGRSLLSGGWDETVRIWNLTGTRPTMTLNWPVGRVSSLAVAPDGMRAVVGGETGGLSVWDLDD